jgi:hypothetical protein
MPNAASHCRRGRAKASRKRNGYPSPICARTFVKTHSVRLLHADVRNTARGSAQGSATGHGRTARQIWHRAPGGSPASMAAPRPPNMKPGWIRSHSVQPSKRRVRTGVPTTAKRDCRKALRDLGDPEAARGHQQHDRAAERIQGLQPRRRVGGGRRGCGLCRGVGRRGWGIHGLSA